MAAYFSFVFLIQGKDRPSYEEFKSKWWVLAGDEIERDREVKREEEAQEEITADQSEIWKSIRKQQNLKDDYNNILKEHNKKLSAQRRNKK